MVIVEFSGSIVVSSAVGNLCIVPTAVPIGTIVGEFLLFPCPDFVKILFDSRGSVPEVSLAPEVATPGLFAVPHEHFCHFRLLALYHMPFGISSMPYFHHL